MNIPPTIIRPIAALALVISLLATDPPACAETARADSRITEGKGAPGFNVISLRRPGVILATDSGDFNGDGETDLLIFHKPSKETYEKFCSIYLQQNGGFKEVPAHEISMGEGVSAVAIADVDSDGEIELCGFGGDGMIVFDPRGKSSAECRRTIEHPTLLPGISRHLVVVNWIADLNSDGRIDAVLPDADGLHMFVSGEGGDFSKSRSHELPMRASVHGASGQSYVSYRLPAIRFADFDGDGHTDIGAFDVEQMSFFLTDGSPASIHHVSSPLLREFTKDFVAASDFPDLNSDGMPDAVLVLMSQRKNLQSEIRIYFGREDLSYPDKPDHTYSGDSNLILPMFLDAFGDGKMEMLLQNVNVGFNFFLNYFLRNRIRVDAELRCLAAAARYAEQPAVRRAIYVRVSESGAEPARGVGDFDGDGLDDLVVGTAEDRLSFFLTDREEIMPPRPTFELSVPAYGNMEIANLNDDGRADIIILYPQEDKLGTATLLLSK